MDRDYIDRYRYWGAFTDGFFVQGEEIKTVTDADLILGILDPKCFWGNPENQSGESDDRRFV